MSADIIVGGKCPYCGKIFFSVVTDEEALKLIRCDHCKELSEYMDYPPLAQRPQK